MNTSIESNAAGDDWKNGSFVVTKSAEKERRKVYSGTTTFDGLTIKTSKVPWEYSDLHFIEGNEYVIDSNSIEIVPIISEVSYTSINVGKVSEAYIDNSIARFGLTTSAQNNKTFIYSSPSSFVNYIDAYIRVSGTSSFKGSISYELESDYTYNIQYQINFKYKGEMDNENQQPDSNIDMESNIKGGVVLDCGYSIPVKVFQSNEFPIGSEIRFYDEGFITMPSHINTDDEGNITELAYFEIDYVYFLDLVEGHEYRIDSITPSFINFTSSYRNFDCGNFKNLELLMFSTWKDSDTFIYSESDFNTDNAKYLDAPFSFEYDYKFYGFGGDALGINTLSGDFILDCGFKVNVELTDMTKLRLWEENHPEEEYPEGELVTPNPDGIIPESPSGGGSSTDLSPVVNKIDTATEKITNKIDSSTATISGDIKQQGQKVTQEIEEQSNLIANKFDEQKQELENQTEILEEQKENEKNFFGSFFENLIETVKSLFIPSDEEMQNLLDQLMTFFSDKFGFLFFPFELLGQVLEIFKTDGTTGITFPSFSIMGYEVWPDLTYDIASNEIAGTVFEYVRYATGAMLAMWFINYLRNFFDRRFGGGGN